MNYKRFILAGITCMALFSCTQQDELKQRQILFTVDEFVAEVTTKTNCDPSNNYAITWASGDTIGIFPREGFQEPFAIPANQVGKASASFDGGYWDVKEGLTYNAYYPFSVKNFYSADSKTTIPVVYTGQSQTGTQCNAGAFDYTYSDWTEATDGHVSFNFHHIGAFLVLSLPIPATTTYTKLTLTADSEVIPTSGTYDLTATKPAFVSKTKASSLSMELNSFTGTARETSVFYMMLPPCDLSASTLTAKLTSAAGTTCLYTIESKTITAGKLYEITGKAKSSNVNGTVDDWAEEEDPSNGHAYVDLDLTSGTLWATMNVGASSPEDYGDYFAWGETTGYNSGKTNFDLSTYKWCNGSYTTHTKYCTDSYYGTVDNKTELELEDDAARANWGGSWRMPSKSQQDELRSECTWTWTTQNGVNGYKVSSKKNSNSIFLPAAGYRSGSSLNNAGSEGGYLSRSLNERGDNGADYVYLLSGKVGWSSRVRWGGISVRPVLSE